jgi:hypothetical protein
LVADPQTENNNLQFIYTDPQTELERMFGGFHYINAFGKIEPGDDEKFKIFLETAAPPPRSTIYINSTGGNVEAAIGIGRQIREGWYSTSIGSYHLSTANSEIPMFERKLLAGKCYSAATLIYLGGRLRYFSDGSEFGVHQFSYKDPTPENFVLSQALSAKIAQFIVDMGISLGFLEISSSTPGSEISIIDLERLRTLGVITGGETDVKWSVQARNHMIYVRGERDSLYGHHKVLLAYIKGAGFHFWTFIEAQGREEELTSFELVEIVVNGEDFKIDISERCVRSVFGIYVNILAKLTEDEARLLAFSESFGVHVRGSSEAGMFLGIAAMSTNGGREELETLFSCFSDEPTPSGEV